MDTVIIGLCEKGGVCMIKQQPLKYIKKHKERTRLLSNHKELIEF